MSSTTLPRGIWFEAPRNRYRVKLYRNNVAYFGGYFTLVKDALIAHDKLKAKLLKIPKLKRGAKPDKQVYGGSINNLISSSKQEKDPNNN